MSQTSLPNMGSQVFVAVVCCLTLLEASVQAEKTKNNSVANDVKSEDSVPRFYRNVYAPISVYASSLPYGAYSFQSPIYTSAPRAASSQLVPVKEESVVYQNSNGFLKDSYGNKFVQAPQSIAYKTISPTQFVQIQNLPVHLSQPLVAPSAPSYHLKQSAPHFVNSPVRISTQLASPTPLSFGGYSQPLVYASNVRSLSTPSEYSNYGPQTSQLSNNRVLYSKPSTFQRLVEQKGPQVSNGKANGQSLTPGTKGLHAAQAQHTTVVTGPDGKKTVITLETKPPLPLLDLSLLQPLSFDNPVVPQVQHFLPKVTGVTYHKLPSPTVNEKKNHQKEFVVQKTKSYDSGIIVGKPKVPPPKKEINRPVQNDDDDHSIEVPSKSNKAHREILVDAPVVSYEINKPNHKEIYKEQQVSYNKETNSKPVNYNYDSQTKKEPVNYSYSHSSKKPVENKSVYYENSDNQNPKHLIYTIQNNNNENGENETPENEKPSADSNDSREAFDESEENEDEPVYQHEEYEQPAYIRHVPKHEDSHHNHHDRDVNHNSPKHYPRQSRPQPNDDDDESREDDTNYSSKNSRQKHQNHSPPRNNHNEEILQNYEKKNSPQTQIHKPKPNNNNVYHPISQDTPAHVYEKTKKIIIQEETPDETHSHREQVIAQMIGQEENNEEDFENAYKNAASGFPAYDQDREEAERAVYGPEHFSVPPTHSEYTIKHVPYEEYQEEGDVYPESMRADYKDSRDKVKDDYFTEYSIHRPESMSDYYKKKKDYYKMYQKHLGDESIPKSKPKQAAKYTAAPTVRYNLTPARKPQQYYVRYKAVPHIVNHEFDRSKETIDNSAFDSRPLQMYRSKTHFVEPQFQYGFEPISIPQLLDSELAAMASNLSPESEKAGTRKKVYKENFYIKKTKTLGGKTS